MFLDGRLKYARDAEVPRTAAMRNLHGHSHMNRSFAQLGAMYRSGNAHGSLKNADQERLGKVEQQEPS
jgi:hypothetical protein